MSAQPSSSLAWASRWRSALLPEIQPIARNQSFQRQQRRLTRATARLQLMCSTQGRAGPPPCLLAKRMHQAMRYRNPRVMVDQASRRQIPRWVLRRPLMPHPAHPRPSFTVLSRSSRRNHPRRGIRNARSRPIVATRVRSLICVKLVVPSALPPHAIGWSRHAAV